MNVTYYNPPKYKGLGLVETFVTLPSHTGSAERLVQEEYLGKSGRWNEQGENIQDQILEGREKRKQNINHKPRDPRNSKIQG